MNVNKKIGAVLGAPKANLCRLIRVVTDET